MRRARRVKAPYIRYGPYGPGPDALKDGPQCVAGHVLTPAVASGQFAGEGTHKTATATKSEYVLQHNSLSDSDESVRLFIRQSSPDSLFEKESIESPISEDSCEEDFDQAYFDSSLDLPNQPKLHTQEKLHTSSTRPCTKQLKLPVELTDLISSYVSAPKDLLSLMQVNSAWYTGAVRHLYFRPEIDCKNYNLFVEALSRKNNMAHFIRELDLSNIMQSGKNSYTSRILARCRRRLEVFIAPQTSFGYAPLVSIKQCKRLRVLDLSLVSEKVDLRQLFQAIENARLLERLEFPRSSMLCENFEGIRWPKRLKYLGLAGGLNNEFIENLEVPKTITHLSMSYCPSISEDSMNLLFAKLGSHLKSLSVAYPMPSLQSTSLDKTLGLCPHLQTLKVSIDYVSRELFTRANMGFRGGHPLKSLFLDSSGSLGQGGKMGADDIALAALEDKVPQLRRVKVTRKLGWNPQNEEVNDLAQVLEDRDGGVWLF